MKSNLERFTSKGLDEEFERIELLKVKLLLRQVIVEETIEVITTKSQEFRIVISKRYTYTSRFYEDLVYY